MKYSSASGKSIGKAKQLLILAILCIGGILVLALFFSHSPIPSQSPAPSQGLTPEQRSQHALAAPIKQLTPEQLCGGMDVKDQPACKEILSVVMSRYIGAVQKIEKQQGPIGAFVLTVTSMPNNIMIIVSPLENAIVVKDAVTLKVLNQSKIR